MTGAKPSERTAESESETTRQPVPGRVRHAVVEALVDQPEGLTIREIEDEVGRSRPSPVHESVEEDVQGLMDEGLIERADDTRRLRLSDRGLRFVKGIQVLAGE